MTSKNLFSKNGPLWESCRRHIWIPVFSLVGFLLASLLPIVMIIQEFYESTPDQNSAEYAWTLTNTQENLSQFLTCSYANVFGLIVMAVLGGLGVFFYLHSRSETDFYHSLPITRGQLFAVNYLTTPVIVLPIYVICSILACVVTAATGFGSVISPSLMAFTILSNCLFFLLIYSFAVLAAILCGNRIISALLLIWIDFSVSVFFYLIHGIAGAYLKTYSPPANLENYIFNTSPILAFVQLISKENNIFTGDVTASQFMHSAVPTLGVCAAVFLAATLLCWALFRIRSSENAGNALAFPKCQLPIKIYMVLVMGLTGGFLFEAIISFSSVVWFVVGTLIVGILMHCVVEAIYALDIRAIFRHLPQMALCVAIPLVILACFVNDVAGYDTKTAKLDQITGVSYEDSSYTYASSYYSQDAALFPDKALLTDRESIESAWNIANLCVKNLDSTDNASWGDAGYLNCTITFHLKGGHTLKRSYQVMSDEAVQMSSELTYSEAYSEKYSPIKTMDLSLEDFSIDVHSTVYTEGTETGSVTLNNKDTIQTLLDTIWTEYRQVGLTYLQTHTPIAYLDSSYGSTIGIYPAYTKSLALLQEQGFIPQVPTASNADYITIRYSTDENCDVYNKGNAPQSTDPENPTVFANVTDAKDIAAFLENALNGDATGSAYLLTHPAKAFQMNYVSVYVTFNGKNYACQLTYLDGQEPAALLQKYRSLASSEAEPLPMPVG